MDCRLETEACLRQVEQAVAGEEVCTEETIEKIRDVVSRFVCSLCPQLPFDMIESQLGSVVDDIMQTHLHEPIPDSHSFPYSHFYPKTGNNSSIGLDGMYGEQPAYGRLVEIAVSSTAVFTGLATIVTNKVYVNGLLLLIISLALFIHSLSLEIAPLDIFTHLYSLVFISSSTRNCLLIFWLFNVLVSIAFGVAVNLQGKSTTIHRKFFHLTVSLIYVSGLYLDISFTWLCGWLWLCIFVIIEIFRYFEVPPWSESLNNFLLPFKDEQDTHFLLTPIFLLLGKSYF
ncbi:hypothetical protein WR25_19521 [Diploscapter pachys]|uniref:dolichol kinase n=1 Tax=Diploscapter pachys TaxID=2018661 RepID=A0A2A2LR04_9BILA|nr:hypothetical protein WR25_19521 [Diploscapter pachys]